ncbi:hypothetical protein R3P38DRAFT_3208380 [Favolaschia claudopus]|uniref:WW domain containing adaptor with coiled-coil n=1 Tax=Favolaschia claudopus TaxID=2862362 RepID=A0AAW0A3T5_9AGAR
MPPPVPTSAPVTDATTILPSPPRKLTALVSSIPSTLSTTPTYISLTASRARTPSSSSLQIPSQVSQRVKQQD